MDIIRTWGAILLELANNIIENTIEYIKIGLTYLFVIPLFVFLKVILIVYITIVIFILTEIFFVKAFVIVFIRYIIHEDSFTEWNGDITDYVLESVMKDIIRVIG